MKVLLLLFLCLTALSSSSQSIRATDHSLVKDSSGTVYPASVWQELYRKGGYELRPENPKDTNTAFILVQIPDEKEARLAGMPKPKESNYFRTGKKMNLFDARDMDGNPLDLTRAKGKIIVLNFWFINCGPCRREIPELNALVDSFKNKDQVLFVALALDVRKELETFLAKMPFKYSVVSDAGSIVAQYGVRLYPTHVILDTEGKVYFHTSGLAANTIYWIKKSIKEFLTKEEKAVAAQ